MQQAGRVSRGLFAAVLAAACATGQNDDGGPTVASLPMTDPTDGGTTEVGASTEVGTSTEVGESTETPTGPGCEAPQTACAGGCVDLQTDHDNCGACDSPCAGPEVCVDGECNVDCPPALMACAGTCVDLASNAAHCGGCDSPCDACETCEAGACADPPAPAAPDAVLGEATACVASAAMFSVTPPPGAVDYTWSAPDGASVSAGQGTPAATIQFGTTGGPVCVTYNDGCADSEPACLDVTLDGTPGEMMFDSAVIESFQVPVCITSLRITASGAQGGTAEGGRGATLAGTFAVTPGETLSVVTGRQGAINICNSGGGGGGSFVWRPSAAAEPLIAAGGGGGGNVDWNDPACRKGVDAVIGIDGTRGNLATSAPGGIGGAGGSGTAPSGVGGGGAGWKGNGGDSTFSSPAGGGQSAPTFAGGGASPQFAPGGEGGFGGGGGAVCGCGGGGGYSGGGGGEGQSCRAGGGGGGSFNAGADPMNTAGDRVGDGVVLFVWP